MCKVTTWGNKGKMKPLDHEKSMCEDLIVPKLVSWQLFLWSILQPGWRGGEPLKCMWVVCI